MPVTSALPVARRRIGAWSATIAAAAVVAVAAGVPAIASARRTAEIARIADSGPLAIAVLALLLPFAARVFGVRLARGTLPGWAAAPLVALSLSPVVIAAISCARGARALVPALAVVRSAEVPAVLASGLSASAELTLWAYVVAAAATGMVALGAIASVATIDRERLGAPGGPAWAALGLGAAWFVAAFAVHVVYRPSFTVTPLLTASLAAPLVVTALASIAAWMAPALGRTDLRRESTSGALAIAAAAASGIAFVVLLAGASLAATEAQALAEAAAPALGGAERAGILQIVVEARHAHAVAAAVDVVGAVACFAVPIASALRASREARAREPIASWVTLAVGALALAVGSVVAARGEVESAASSAAAHRAPRPSVSLPEALVPAPPYGHSGGSVVVVDGAGSASVAGAREPWERAEVRADGRATFGAVVDALRAERALELPRPRDLAPAPCTLVLAPYRAVDRAGLGDLGAVVGPTERALDVDVVPASAVFDEPQEDVLTVTLDDPPLAHARRRGRAVDVVLAGGEADGTDVLRATRFRTPSVIRIVPRATDTMERVARVASAVAYDASIRALVAPRIELVAR